MLTRSTPAAPRFRLTARKACRITREVILPVSEWTLILLMVSLSRVAIREFGLAGFGGCFLAPSPVRRFPGFPGKSAGGPILGFSQGANYPHGRASRSPSSVGFPFHALACAVALLRVCCCPLRGGGQGSLLLTTASPAPFRLRLIGGTYRPPDGGGLHRSWLRTVFSRRRHASP